MLKLIHLSKDPIQMITSSQNSKIQWVRSLQVKSHQRREDQAFIAEGVRLVEEALQAGWQARLVLYEPSLSERGLQIVEAYARLGAPVEQVAPQVMRAASDTGTPQGLLAVIGLQELKLPADLDFVFIPDAVRDPGNMGAMLRSASAAGVQAVYLTPGCVDAFSPKVLRAAMGAHFHVPLLIRDWAEIQVEAQRHSWTVYLAAASEGLAYTQADFRQPLALITGGEAEGAGLSARSLAHQQVHIPMPGRAESLNAAIASAVLMFEVVRQRSAAPSPTGG